MEKKKIAIVTPVFMPYRGGMCVVAEQDAEQLSALGHHVDVFVPGEGQPRGKGGYSVKGMRPWYRFGHAVLVPSVMRACRGYDLTVIHYPFYGGAEPLALARMFSKCGKMALYYHMDTVGHGIVWLVSRVHGLFMRRWIIDSADRILVSSFDYARSSAIGKIARSEPGRLRELPPAVDVDRFAPGEKRSDLIKRYGLDTSRPTVVFVGGLDKAHYFKGVEILIKAMASECLEGMQAVIVGDGELRGSYEKMASTLGVSGRVAFAGAVSDEELPEHYRLADVFAFPSTDRSEAFGIAALEAMSTGVPVVASDLPGVRTIVRDGETGFLVKPGSVSALTARLHDLVDDSRLRAEFGENGRRMAVDEFSVPRRTEKWRRMIEELTGEV
jgi:glycosyltransferase involved in cell wall biosynthesis